MTKPALGAGLSVPKNFKIALPLLAPGLQLGSPGEGAHWQLAFPSWSLGTRKNLLSKKTKLAHCAGS